MKTFEHPLFLMTALCLFFPIGLVLLISSDHPLKRKYLMATGGALVFTALLATAFIGLPKKKEIDALELTVTKSQLTVGQSGGFSVDSSAGIITDFTATASNDHLRIEDNVYTAVKEGTTVVSIRAEGIEKSFTVTVVGGSATDSIVFLSPTGERYHDSETHAGKNAVDMTEEEALQSGKRLAKFAINKNPTRQRN